MTLPALAQALDAGGEEGRKGFHAHLAALDQLVRGGEEVSEAVLLGSLLMHLRRGIEGEAGADGLLTALVQTARLPRRVAERTRLAIGAQRHRTARRGAGAAGAAWQARDTSATRCSSLFRFARDRAGEYTAERLREIPFDSEKKK